MMGEDGAPGVMPIAVKELFDSAAKDDEHDEAMSNTRGAATKASGYLVV